ncbi:cysteine--1-D-myo-inosityl 2-amino-2-deoxy-alpha-D-glucopyranoside ligase [Dermabacteraceae bacterium TAE3-ERU27]|nr:cysteine--1-D-myo-inosityl 2-amino-2-deoxy-alpha-D-glucopyranoside ligase [Dermabacteraceae bacterium TAE3-ERU27]
MRSWSSPEVVTETALREPLRLFDTASRSKREIVGTGGLARIYTCGITPYDSTHLGHAATYHTADLVRRTLQDSGLRVEAAQNVTDVDDPLLERAAKTGVDWRELAREQSELFASDMEHLRIIAPESYRTVSEEIPGIVEIVAGLAKAGYAYRVPTEDALHEGDRDWYLDLSAGGDLGGVCGMSREEMLAVFAERGGDPERPGKRGKFDPLLWRVAREGEPSWEAEELGAGRPGWHVGCVRIAGSTLELPFDVQIGGSDLAFPHHDMCHSHAKALGKPGFAGVYAHVGMVALDGEKMSKSLGNLVFVSKLVAGGEDPRAIRLVLLSQHYRRDWEWRAEMLAGARERLGNYRRAAAANDPETCLAVRRALRDDLDTPKALRLLDSWAQKHAAEGEAEGGAASEPGDVARLCDSLLGLRLA